MSQPPRKSSSGPGRGDRPGPRIHTPGRPHAGPSRPGPARNEPPRAPPRDLSRDLGLGPGGAGYLVPGERAVVELLRADPRRIRRLLVLVNRPPGDAEALADEMATVIGPDLARGIVAVAKPPREHDIEDLLALQPAIAGRRRLLVALDGVQDPHNLGALIRSAEFFGALGMFWARDRSASLSPTVVRSSAGASERLALGQVTNLARSLAACKEAGFWILGTVADGDVLDDQVGGGRALDRAYLGLVHVRLLSVLVRVSLPILPHPGWLSRKLWTTANWKNARGSMTPSRTWT